MLDYSLEKNHGIILNKCSVGLDVSGPVAKHVFVSHAHADHLPRDSGMHVYASEATARLMRARGFRGKITPVEFHKPLELDSCRVTLYPAGHILGSAMIRIESDEGHTFYTGDFKSPPSPVSEGFSAPDTVDYFITEATFSLPIYKWKPHDALFAEIREFAENSLTEGYTPVFLCYNLGKAQEVMHALAPLNRTLQIHGAGYELCKIYEEFGFDLGQYERYDRETVQEKRILITPSSSLEQPMLRNIRKKKIAYVSGWATHESRRVQLTVDKLFPLSDHVDFFQLLEICRKLNPKRVYITHTPNPAVVKHYLDQMGISSQPLNMEAFDHE
jgi:putative mRNA 3-end processing factor